MVAVSNTVTVIRNIELLKGVRLVRSQQRDMWPRTAKFTWAMFISALVSLVLSVITLFGAALSLAYERDVAPAVAFAWLAGVSMLLLLPQIAGEWWIRGMTYFDEEVLKAKTARARETDPTYMNVKQP
ncbi:hypothetical protein ACAG24_009755 [Mycobacterium sp. pW049]|uniref:hypothetical protein n=1 Tax=[Mycobacterium] bulgaricum TaxID=3238985 RepID=UPI00351B1C96